MIIMTSNSEKNLPDAFLRRVAYYHIPFPDAGTLLTIIQSKVDGYSEAELKPIIAFFDQYVAAASSVCAKTRLQPSGIEWAALLRRLDFPAEKLEDPDNLTDVERTNLDFLLFRTGKKQRRFGGVLKKCKCTSCTTIPLRCSTPSRQRPPHGYRRVPTGTGIVVRTASGHRSRHAATRTGALACP